jgi:hypothetical protein
MAQELANQHTDYFPDRPGRWVYDRKAAPVETRR